MKKIRVLHIAEIDNDVSKGTSKIVPEYIIEQNKSNELDISFLNCNNLIIPKLKNEKQIYSKKDNIEMKVIKDINPKLVVFHEIYKSEYLKIYKYLIKHNIPYIIIPHGGMTKSAQSKKKYKKIPANLLLFNRFFKNARAIQYLSETERNNTAFTKLNYYILGNGINDIPNKNLYLLKKQKKDNELLSLIYVGRYDYIIKGLDQLLVAMRLVKEKKYKNIKLTLFGKGLDKDINLIKKNIFDNNLEELISFNGPIFGTEKRDELLKHDIFIQVSRTEGQPLGVMEAMSLGMPVILSEGTGFKEIIVECNNGNVVKTDGYSIFDGIIKTNKERRTFQSKSINSYKYAIDNYSWGNIINKTIKIYKKYIK